MGVGGIDIIMVHTQKMVGNILMENGITLMLRGGG